MYLNEHVLEHAQPSSDCAIFFDESAHLSYMSINKNLTLKL